MASPSCSRCEHDEPIAKGLCRRCYQYRYKYGRDRPPELFMDEERIVALELRRFNRRLICASG